MSSPDSTPRQLRDRLLPPAGPRFVLDERLPVLVEFETTDQQASPLSEVEHTQASEKAINSALNSVRHVAKMVSEAMTGLPNGPSQMDVRFGIRLDASGKAFVVESGEAASLAITLTWTPSSITTSDYSPREVGRANEGWMPPTAEGAPEWPRDPYRASSESRWEEDDWEEDEDVIWEDEVDDYPPYDSRGYAPEDYDRGISDDEDDDFPEPPSWPRRSPRSPWNRNRPGGSDPRSRWP